MAFTDQLRIDGSVNAELHADRRKATFDNRVLKEIPKADREKLEAMTSFAVGDLVQVYESRRDGTHETKAKLLPKWSPPRRVLEKRVNSYKIATLEGLVLGGWTHARRMRKFQTRVGSKIAAEETERAEEALLATADDREEGEGNLDPEDPDVGDGDEHGDERADDEDGEESESGDI